MSNPLVNVAREDGIAHIHLNRPDKLNAINQPMAEGLLAALAEAAADPLVRAVVLRGEGRAFCVGADLSAVASEGFEERRRWIQQVTDLHLCLRQLTKPVIARVHGYALGAGCSLALACDLAIAAENAVLSYPEVAHGLAPGVSMVFLRETVGPRTALELILTARRLSGREAAERGLVNRAVPEFELDDAVQAMASQIADMSPTALRMSKELFYRLADMPLEEQLTAGQDIVLVARVTEDAREGAAAFKERRKPRWIGR